MGHASQPLFPPANQRLRWLLAAVGAIAVGAIFVAQDGLASPALLAATYRISAGCQAFADGAGHGSRRQVAGTRLCPVVGDLGQMLLGPRLAAVAPPAAAPAYPLAVSANGRYLIDQNGAPFLMVGDSPQAIIANLSEPDADLFLSNRTHAGFNSVWVNLVCNNMTGCRQDGQTFDGLAPFSTPGDLSAPNEAYFARADRVIAMAGKYGLTVVLDPIETSGWLNTLKSNGTDATYRFGQYLGNRYRSFPNIVWMSGNDFQTWKNADDDATALAVARGIKEADPAHVQTVELNYQVSSSIDDPNWVPLIQLNAAYTYSPTYAEIAKDYNRASQTPVFMVEANYEFEHDYRGPATLRRQEYWTMLSGATGQLYGNKYTWQFIDGWKTHLDTIGSLQMRYVTDLFAPRRWYDLVPDQGHTLVTAGYGTFTDTGNVNDNDYVTAARTSDGTLAIAYVPTGRTLTVELDQIAGPVMARWYDPSSGAFSSIADALLSNAGAHDFNTPGRNREGDSDWVLVLEAVTQ